VEGPFVLDEFLGDRLEDAAGLGAGLGELVEGELAFEFDGVARGSRLVPGHGWAPCKAAWGANSGSVARGAPPGSVVIIEQVGISVLAEANFRDGSRINERVEAEDVGGLLAGEDGGDVEEEALSAVVENHRDNRRVGDDEVFICPEVVDLASRGLGVLYALVKALV